MKLSVTDKCKTSPQKYEGNKERKTVIKEGLRKEIKLTEKKNKDKGREGKRKRRGEERGEKNKGEEGGESGERGKK